MPNRNYGNTTPNSLHSLSSVSTFDVSSSANYNYICNFPWHGPFPVSTGVLGSCSRPAHDQRLEKAAFYTFPCCLRYYLEDKQEGQDYILSLFLFLRPSHCCPGFAGLLLTLVHYVIVVTVFIIVVIWRLTRIPDVYLKSLPSTW